MLRITTLLGLLLGFACVIFGISYYTKDFTVYLNLPGLLVVLGGLIGALLLSYRATVIFRITRSIRKAFFRHTELPREIASRFVEYAKLLSERGISALEEEAAKLPKNSVERLALELVIAGYKPEDIERIIEDEIRTKQVIDEVDAEVFETLAKYAPSFESGEEEIILIPEEDEKEDKPKILDEKTSFIIQKKERKEITLVGNSPRAILSQIEARTSEKDEFEEITITYKFNTKLSKQDIMKLVKQLPSYEDVRIKAEIILWREKNDT